MQVSRLSLLLGLLILFFLSAPPFFLLLLLLLFSPFSVRCTLRTCHVPSILAACLLPSICLFSFFFSLAQINSAYPFFSVYVHMQTCR